MENHEHDRDLTELSLVTNLNVSEIRSNMNFLRFILKQNVCNIFVLPNRRCKIFIIWNNLLRFFTYKLLLRKRNLCGRVTYVYLIELDFMLFSQMKLNIYKFTKKKKT